jgi:hypothetical protein
MKIEKFAHRLFVLSGLLLATDADEVRATASRDLPLPPAATDEGVRAHRSHRHLRSRHERDRERLMYPPASLRRSDGADALSSSIGSQTPTPTVSSTTTSTTTAATMQSRRSELLAAVRSRVRTDAMLPNARLETLVQQVCACVCMRRHCSRSCMGAHRRYRVSCRVVTRTPHRRHRAATTMMITASAHDSVNMAVMAMRDATCRCCAITSVAVASRDRNGSEQILLVAHLCEIDCV